MFDTNYSFKGTHAVEVKKLTGVIEDYSKIFERNMDVYKIAPIVGFVYKKRVKLNSENGVTREIPLETLSKEKEFMEFSYKLIMLLDEEYEKDFEKRKENAFKYSGKEVPEKNIERFESYVRGGVEILSEKLLTLNKDYDETMSNILSFLEEIISSDPNLSAEQFIEYIK